ncbi:methylglyoxal synthase [Streptomyces daliensis]|uniref:Methylglyoxal synthase n=1 Tax=Streptomyces daliensis TaxID=299421 RepID=A0A8T4INC6_9ACTN|nr:methylglyoxal synthase [Streptomyces daliensis]
MIGLVAHDARKAELMRWVRAHRLALQYETVVATAATARGLREEVGLPAAAVRAVASGPVGGDQQIGALIAQGELAGLVFFWDPLWAAPHASDVFALLRLATLHNVPTAVNLASAEAIVAAGLDRLRRVRGAGPPLHRVPGGG